MSQLADDKPKEITDWKGNPIKEGDEICLIQIKTSIRNFTLPDRFWKEAGLPAESDCWVIGEYKKVGKNLLIESVIGENSVRCHVSLLAFLGNYIPVRPC